MACSVLHATCHTIIRDRLEIEVEYQTTVHKEGNNAAILCDLTMKICNTSTTLMVEDMVGNIVDSLFHFLHVHSEDYESLSRLIEARTNEYEVAA